MASERLLARALLRNVFARRNYGGHGRKHKVATMNDLPVPEGDFFALHAARQRKNNTVLALGIAFFASAIIVWKESKLINLNWAPPASID